MFELNVIATSNFNRGLVEFEAGGVYKCSWYPETFRYIVEGIGGHHDFYLTNFKMYFRTTDLKTLATDIDNNDEKDRFFMIDDCAQSWGDIAQELWERYRVIFAGSHPVKVIKRERGGALLVIGHEGDGKMWFDKVPGGQGPYCYVNSFDVALAPDLIHTLSRAIVAAHKEA